MSQRRFTFWQWLIELIDRRGLNCQELSRRLGLGLPQISGVSRDYHTFTIPKKSGKSRRITAPNNELKQLQRRILRRLLARLEPHPMATGFRKGLSFVENARIHQAQGVVIRIDLVDFFPSIHREKVTAYFRRVGWSRKASRLLADLTTCEGRLPQGAPTSPALSNLVNYELDARISKLVSNRGGIYSRYADDITVSFSRDQTVDLKPLLALTFSVIRELGYEPHVGKKFDVRRPHQRQTVNGLVVNDRANLPRETRRWLRAVRHRTEVYHQGGFLVPPPTLTKRQLAGWQALQTMIDRGTATNKDAS